MIGQRGLTGFGLAAPASAAALALGLLACAGPVFSDARAADFGVMAAPEVIDPANRFEVRFGVFAHGVGGVERNTVALNAEIVSPRFFFATGPWAFLVPRVHAGGMVNLSGRTSIAYTGLLWTIPVFDHFFIEGFIGPAVHDGSLTPTPTHVGLGCDVLFHSGASIGYRISEQWTVMGTFTHLSNGREAFNVNCGTNRRAGGNQGLNHYGVRIGYSF